MVILTTLFNADKYIEQCLGSIISQTHTDFKCYIMDDLSTDKSISLVQEVIKDDNRFILIKNKLKLYQTGNYDNIIRNNVEINDDEVIIEIDGDDWLAHSNVLKNINNLYENSEIWVANGSFKYSDGRKGFASAPININNIRNETFTATHLRTWKAFLWRAIDTNDLKDENGDYWSVAGDLSFMYPMIEMASDEHYHFMPDINYVYNEENEINEHKLYLDKVYQIANKIRNKEKYKKLII